MATVAANLRSGDPDTDSLLASVRWNPTLLLRYGFPLNGATWTGYTDNSEPYQNYAPLNAAQQAVVTAIFKAIEGFANISFVNSASVGEAPETATFRFGMTDETEVAHAYLPDSHPVGGDVWFNRSSGEFNNPVRGDYAYSAIMHEIGHALGLLHPHDGDNFGTMSLTHDNMNYSAMSYRSYPGMSLDAPFPNEDFGFPQTFMMYDIAALQHMYGANFNSLSGSTSYRWDPVTGYLSIDGSVSVVPGGNTIFMTIWDGGGVDTYDFSTYSTNLVVNLIPGEWTITAQSQLADLGDGHNAIGNIANAFLYQGDLRSLIENANGGSGDDMMTGNQVANSLRGGTGADTFKGGGGNDSLDGGDGDNDTAIYAGNRQDYEIGTAGQVTVRDLNPANGDEGTDTLSNIEFVQFADIKIQLGINSNNAPVLGDPAMIDQSWADGVARSYVIPGTSFIDIDGNHTLSFTATLSNGAPLPAWLTFAPATRTFSGTPPVDQIGASLEIRVTASDGQASVSDVVVIGVTQAPGADIYGTNGPDVLDGTFRDETIIAMDGDDVLRGSAGADRLAGESGTDQADYSASPQAVTIDLATGAGAGGDAQGDLLLAIEGVVGSGFNDHLSGDAGQNRLDGRGGDDWLEGNAGEDLLLGGSGNDALVGGDNNDVLDGGTGLDSMAGGVGSDVFHVDNPGDTVIELAGEGIDEVRTGLASYALGANVEKLTGISVTGQALVGNGGANIIAGAGGNDLLDGGLGADLLSGGAGDDVYLADDGGDSIIELAGGGSDEVRAGSSSFTLGSNVENLTGTSNAGQTLTGNGLANLIAGGAGNDLLDGGSGADLLRGGAGNDVYLIDDGGDVVTELAGEGTDEIRTSLVAYSIAGMANVENLTGLSLSQSLTGNALANLITAGAGNDVLDGGLGADRLAGGIGDDIYFLDQGGDVVTELAGQGFDEVRTALGSYVLAANVELLTGTSSAGQALTGNDLSNLIVAGSGNDVLDGGAGADILQGGAGNDVYFVDDSGDTVTELAGGGSDEVRTILASYTLGSTLENLNGTSALGQVLTGNTLANVILGGTGNDMLDGGAGADVLRGGLGNDIYLVADSGDTVTELAGEGSDEVRTGLTTFTLGANLEKLTGTSASGQVLTGNNLVNIIFGGTGNDVLDGGTGADVLRGGMGNDVYVVDETGDNVAELAGWGTDEVRTGLASYMLADHFENLTGTSASGQVLVGNILSNFILGGSGNDVINGGAGADVLRGALGNDIYIVDDPGDNLAELTEGGTDEVRTSLAAFSLFGLANFENLTGTSASGQILEGNGLANIIIAGTGNDLLDGGAGADVLRGGMGNDVYVIGETGDNVAELAGWGTDEVRTGLASYMLADHFENLTGTSASGQVLVGNSLSNTITGGAGSDALDGAGGADLLIGGVGDDVYHVDNVGDTITELAGAGYDEVRTAVSSFTLAANVEKLTGTSGAGQALTGNGLANLIVAGSGNDLLDGGGGADALQGGLGNDVYVVDDAGDSVTELAGGGSDEIRTGLASYTIAGLANVENLTGLGHGDQILTGNGLDNIINGGAGADTMTGGLGNDTYIVDSGGDKVIELAGEGNDTIRTSLLLYDLRSRPEIENLAATTDSARQFRGNGLNNVITGAGGNDFLILYDGGNDTVIGGGGNDVILFGATLTSADSVDGGTGTDQAVIQGDYSAGLTLGANFVGIESFAILPGSDTRFGDPGTNFYDYDLTTVDSNVAAGVVMVVDANRLRVGEDFTFDGSAESDGAFFIYGGRGTDDFLGGSRNDTFYFGENGQFGSTDNVNGGSGGIDQLGLRGSYTIVFGANQLVSIESIGLVSAQDTRFGAMGSSYNYSLTMNDGNVASGVRMTVDAAPLRPSETFTFDGSAEVDGSFRIFGGQGTDSIRGSQSNDFITGGLGSDSLRGSGGNDSFIYRTVAESTSAARDTIHDFSSGDLINLSQIDANSSLGGDQTFTFIGAGAFSNTAGELRAMFDSGNNVWTVQGDVNGDGIADIELFVSSDHPLVGGDFAL